MTFDRELKLKHIKKESCLKWGKKCDGQYLKGIETPQFPKVHRLPLFFLFFSIFRQFLYFRLLGYIDTLVKKF